MVSKGTVAVLVVAIIWLVYDQAAGTKMVQYHITELQKQYSKETITVTAENKYTTREGIFGQQDYYHIVGSDVNGTQHLLNTYDSLLYHSAELNQTKSFVCMFSYTTTHSC